MKIKQRKYELIHFVLTYRWFDEIVSGRKHIEYREMTPHWKRRLWDRRYQIVAARFSRGYTSTAIICPVSHIDIGDCPYDGYDGDYYRIHFDMKGELK